MIYPFTQQEMEAANAEWGCNCGPSALAFALQKPIAAVRHAIPKFDERRYTSPTMMQAGLAFFRQAYRVIRPPTFVAGRPNDVETLCDEPCSLVRIQWCGPWTAPGANPKWAYRQTHWIATWKERGVPLVFDCNGGIRALVSWIDEIVPVLSSHAVTPRANGEWFPTHIWRLAVPA